MHGGSSNPPVSRADEEGLEDTPLSLRAPAVVFPLPGGRDVAASAWVALSPVRALATDRQVTTRSAGDRRNSLARRFTRFEAPGVYGDPGQLPALAEAAGPGGTEQP